MTEFNTLKLIQELNHKNIDYFHVTIDYSKGLGIVLAGPKDRDYFNDYEYQDTSQIYVEDVKEETNCLKELKPLITGMQVTKINNYSLNNMDINEVRQIILNIFKDNSLKNKNTITFTLDLKSVYTSIYSSVC